MRPFLKVLPQYLVPQHAYTRFFGWLAKLKCTYAKNWMIHTFIRRYNVNMSEAIIENPEAYSTFNEFFTRHLKPELRPITHQPNELACPVDGCLSQIGNINNTSIFQAKGFDYSLNALLGGNEKLAAEFKNGHFATLYLSPKDYHRVHMPCDGKLRESIYIPGKLFSVNQVTASSVPELFARNERLVAIFDTAIGPMALIFVGAIIVGKIRTTWENTTEKLTLQKGQEAGYFELGSTVILLFGENALQWRKDLSENSKVTMGESIGTF